MREKEKKETVTGIKDREREREREREEEKNWENGCNFYINSDHIREREGKG